VSARPAPAELARLSEEVARDPRSVAFFPLAEAYAGSGRAEPALRLCLRGLEHHPEHVEAHVLLGRLYAQQGQALKAFDEWDIALRLEPEHEAARREIGLLALEQRNWDVAVRHLELALQRAPDDGTLAEALARARSRGAGLPAAAPEPDPFTAISDARIQGVVVLDAQGYVLGGEMRMDGEDRGADLAAALRGASDEAARALRHLGLGEWKAILLETPKATVHLAPLDDAMLAVAASREAPTGWVVRQAARLRSLASAWLSRLGGEAR
jgi:tetratricopeptide (TPR) repeat protein